MEEIMYRTLLLLVVSLAGVAQAAQSTNCTHVIVANELPYTISNAGVYCLNSSLYYSGNGTAITLNVTSSQGATLDLNGYSLTYSGTDNSAKGIAISSSYNYLIQNGTIISFATGVWIGYSVANVKVKDIMVVSASNAGVDVEGSLVVVDRCFL